MSKDETTETMAEVIELHPANVEELPPITEEERNTVNRMLAAMRDAMIPFLTRDEEE